MRHCGVALEIDQQPVLEAEQDDQWEDDDSQRDPEDATASERSAPESSEKRPGHAEASEVAFHDLFRRLAQSRGGMGHVRGQLSIAAWRGARAAQGAFLQLFACVLVEPADTGNEVRITILSKVAR
jgi:hypothetical protein